MSADYLERFPVELIYEKFVGVIESIQESVINDPEFFLKMIPDNNGKSALQIDIEAEAEFDSYLSTYMPGVRLFGEECKERIDPEFDLSTIDQVCVLVDMVDGTDLLERGLYNWCSSAVFFHPQLDPGCKILAAFIGVPGSLGPAVYFGIPDSKPRVFEGTNPRDVEGPSDLAGPEKASVCFYGQKAERLQYTASQDVFKPTKANGKMRIYNLAGMPMITKLIDKQVKNASTIDAVFELKGQSPHDVVPGAFLAMEAGCAVINLDTGHAVTKEELEISLMKPFSERSKLRYVIAATEDLAERIKADVKLDNDSGDSASYFRMAARKIGDLIRHLLRLPSR